MAVTVTLQNPTEPSSEDSSSTETAKQALGKAVKKRWHSKTRTGCDMCKKRRVKCDELKPSCLRCKKKGIPCPGYNPPVVRIFELSDEPDFDSASDKQAFDAFITKGSRIFAISNNTSMDLWVRTIPQLAYRHKAVRHAIIAIGAVQLRAMNAQQISTALDCHGNPTIPETTQVHRVRALQKLYKSDPAELPIEVVVSCAMFMMVLDIWTDNGGGPGFHLVAAYRLLQEHCESLRMNGLPPSHEVAHLFIPGIDYSIITSMSVVDDFPSPACGIPSNYRLLLHLPSIGTFNNFTDALYNLDLINKAVARYSFGHHAPGIELNITTALSSFLSRVRVLFEAGQLCRHSADENLFREAYLSGHHRATKIMCQTAGYTSEAQFSPYHDEDFTHILSSMKLWLTGESATPVRKRKPNLGVIPPLFLVATKCRRPQLRSEAIALLHSTSRCERGWNSCIATTLASLVGSTEELGIGSATGRSPDESDNAVKASHHQLLMSLDKVDLIPTEGRMRVRYWEQRGFSGDYVLRRSVKRSVPYQSERNAMAPIVDPLSARTLRAYGYTGILLMAPELPACQCLWPDTGCQSTETRISPSAMIDVNYLDHGGDLRASQTKNQPGQPKWWYEHPSGLVAGSSGWMQWRPEGFDERGGG